MGTWLNLLPQEMQLGDDWDDRIFDHLEMMMEPQPEKRLNCRLIFQDGSERLWHTSAPMRVYRP